MHHPMGLKWTDRSNLFYTLNTAGEPQLFPCTLPHPTSAQGEQRIKEDTIFFLNEIWRCRFTTSLCAQLSETAQIWDLLFELLARKHRICFCHQLTPAVSIQIFPLYRSNTKTEKRSAQCIYIPRLALVSPPLNQSLISARVKIVKTSQS